MPASSSPRKTKNRIRARNAKTGNRLRQLRSPQKPNDGLNDNEQAKKMTGSNTLRLHPYPIRQSPLSFELPNALEDGTQAGRDKNCLVPQRMWCRELGIGCLIADRGKPRLAYFCSRTGSRPTPLQDETFLHNGTFARCLNSLGWFFRAAEAMPFRDPSGSPTAHLLLGAANIFIVSSGASQDKLHGPSAI